MGLEVLFILRRDKHERNRGNERKKSCKGGPGEVAQAEGEGGGAGEAATPATRRGTSAVFGQVGRWISMDTFTDGFMVMLGLTVVCFTGLLVALFLIALIEYWLQ